MSTLLGVLVAIVFIAVIVRLYVRQVQVLRTKRYAAVQKQSPDLSRFSEGFVSSEGSDDDRNSSPATDSEAG